MIYLDYSATSPMSENALEVFSKVSRELYGNTMSLHDAGTQASRLLEMCRETLANFIGADAGGVTFTSGGSESNALAILGIARANAHRGRQILAAPGEHASIINTLTFLEKEGFDICYLPLDEEGRVTPDQLTKSISSRTSLAVIGHVNSETGVEQDIAALGEILHSRQILFHCDAVQSFTKLPIRVNEAYITSLSASSHKVGGPKGVGMMYIHPSVQYEALLPDGTHENGRRQGTVNLPGIAAFTAAAEEALDHQKEITLRLTQLKQMLINRLIETPYPFVIESKNAGIPYILGLRIKGLEGQYVMLECNRRQIAVATGSACKAGQQTPSRTLRAMGRSKDESRELIRLSFGSPTTADDIQKTADTLIKIAENHNFL